MVLEDSGLNGIRKDFGTVDKVVRGLGFDRWAWDYNKAVYDLKLEDQGTVYYLRVPAEAIQGRLESPKATVELGDPVFGRHLHPHGIDYEVTIPESLEKTVKEKVEALKEALS
ncbi:YugN-like family protein [Planifilum fulgidum]|jgi:hypothetical protein|uniref:YugN-like family protein n=1 Tax=Planifilum fulgidum TaxID=201973 RepID=A0A1I2MW03_9BACL|nr:YugN family protein [Planifilum fulgidum]MBO2496268.1 hypothetical protein [Bacillota bacterium]MBO2533546.1 hypothetical protein [Thermoactinomycetaceae bacterium]SFF93311.1 YugN-like family protein [Planifilum fulgidum]